MRLHTRSVQDIGDIRAFFDGIAGGYRETHGSAARLLAYRLALIRSLLGPHVGGVLLEIGCGPGAHLFSLADAFSRIIGTDLSPNMIATAELIRRTHPCAARIELHAEPAERLASIEDQAADVVLCVGAFEHMPDKAAVLGEVRRVLKPHGRFVCLTLNGDYLWYRRVAPLLGYNVQHLSSDRFVNAAELRALLREAGLRANALGYWRFVAKGDMPGWTALGLEWLDRVGVVCRPSLLRGGLYCCADKDVMDGSAPVDRDD
jgi:ubiquinone/menaquinone biosynthesis C-methylase UbiE